MPTLKTLTEAEAAEMGSDIARLEAGAQTMEQLAHGIVRHLYENLVDDTGARDLALTRFYKTPPYGNLDSDL